MNYFSILLLPALVHIIYADIKEYRISLLTVLFAGIISFMRLFKLLHHTMIGQTLLLNILFTLTLLGVLFTYCSIRRINLFNVFGWGDILFLVVALLSFAPFTFVLYIILSSLMGILYFFTLRLAGKDIKQIPFAGIMAAIMLVLFILDMATSYSTYSDSWLIEF